MEPVAKIDVASVRFGSDAEVFLQDATGRFFPACGLIGGTKEEPLKLTSDGVMVQEDNVMLEFNVPVSSTSKEWVANLQRAMDISFKKIPPTMRPVIVATARFDPLLLNNEQAMTFGCEPDFNAWTMEQNPKPNPEDPTMRSAAAHVHISWKDPTDMEQKMRLIQLADIFVTLPSLQESPDTERRKLYGKAGAFRPKEYGVEHRVLDNYWLQHRDYMEAVFLRYQRAIRALNQNFEITQKLADAVQAAINTYDAKAAFALHGACLKKLAGERDEADAVVYKSPEQYYLDRDKVFSKAAGKRLIDWAIQQGPDLAAQGE